MIFTPLLDRSKRLALRGWGLWKVTVDWLDTNRKYVFAVLIALNLFGMIAPETATALRDAVLGLAI